MTAKWTQKIAVPGLSQGNGGIRDHAGISTGSQQVMFSKPYTGQFGWDRRLHIKQTASPWSSQVKLAPQEVQDKISPTVLPSTPPLWTVLTLTLAFPMVTPHPQSTYTWRYGVAMCKWIIHITNKMKCVQTQMSKACSTIIKTSWSMPPAKVQFQCQPIKLSCSSYWHKDFLLFLTCDFCSP